MRKPRKTVCLLSCLFLLLSQGCQQKQEKNRNTKWGDLQTDSYETVKQEFDNPDMIYAPYLFWFWDEPLNRNKVQTMAREMLNQRFNLGYIHGRISMYELLKNTSGLEHAMSPSEGLPDEEWMTEKWMTSIADIMELAKEKNAYVGYNDEYM